MADTTIATANRVKQWDSNFFKSYVRANRFKKYMGTSTNAIIQVIENLTKQKGDAITVPLVGALDDSGGANDGSSDLVGNEKALPNDGHQITVGVVRDAVVVNMEEEQASPVDIRNAGKDALKTLAMRYLRTAITNALHSIDGVNYGSATEGNKDTWLTNNSDRVLFGADIGNQVAGDHSASLLTVDATNDKLNKALVSKIRRMAQEATTANSDGIRPHSYGEDEETFILFVGSRAFRDLKTDMNTVLTDAEKRGKSNPLFRGGIDLYWDGVVVREIKEIPVLAGVGAAAADVEPIFLCGAQAIGVAWAKRTKTTIRKEDDYGFKHGVGFFEMRGVEKVQYGTSTPIDWGVVTGYVAAAADA